MTTILADRPNKESPEIVGATFGHEEKNFRQSISFIRDADTHVKNVDENGACAKCGGKLKYGTREAGEPVYYCLSCSAQHDKSGNLRKRKTHLDLMCSSIDDILASDYPEQSWGVKGIFAEGLNLFVGKQKIGKSWLMLGLTYSIARGEQVLGSIDVAQGRVLYLALEDSNRRIKERLLKLFGPSASVRGKADLATRWPRMGRGGMHQLETYVQKYPDTRLVIIDTLAKFRPVNNESVSSNKQYTLDYEDMTRLKNFADEHHLCLIVVHHCRKAEATDIFDQISGSTGLTGAADVSCVLSRSRGTADAVLSITGRDVEERELLLKKDPDTQRWTIVGEGLEQSLTLERRKILDVVRAHGVLTPIQICRVLGLDDDSKGSEYSRVKKAMGRMMADGILDPAQATPGAYTVTDEYKVPFETAQHLQMQYPLAQLKKKGRPRKG